MSYLRTNPSVTRQWPRWHRRIWMLRQCHTYLSSRWSNSERGSSVSIGLRASEALGTLIGSWGTVCVRMREAQLRRNKSTVYPSVCAQSFSLQTLSRKQWLSDGGSISLPTTANWNEIMRISKSLKVDQYLADSTSHFLRLLKSFPRVY